MRKHWWIAALVTLMAAILMISLYPRFRQPPLAARLLPDWAEGYLYIDLKPIRSVTSLGTGSILQGSEAQAFLAETGIVPERDIDEFALAVLPEEMSASGTAERRLAEAFSGRYDAARLEKFLRRRAKTVDRYSDYEIYIVPREDRTVRVVMLDVALVAATNTRGPEAIHAIIDRFQRRRPARARELLRKNYSRVPVGAVAWAVLRLNRDAQHGVIPLPGDNSLLLPHDTEVTGWARVLSSLELAAEARCPREEEAKKLAASLRTYLAIFSTIQITMGTKGPDADAKQLFEKLRIEQEGSRVSASVSVPLSFLRKLTSGQGKQP